MFEVGDIIKRRRNAPSSKTWRELCEVTEDREFCVGHVRGIWVKFEKFPFYSFKAAYFELHEKRLDIKDYL